MNTLIINGYDLQPIRSLIYLFREMHKAAETHGRAAVYVRDSFNRIYSYDVIASGTLWVDGIEFYVMPETFEEWKKLADVPSLPQQ